MTWSDHWSMVNHLHKEDYLEDEDRDLVTVGKFSQGRPQGLAWQWRSKGRITENIITTFFLSVTHFYDSWVDLGYWAIFRHVDTP